MKYNKFMGFNCVNFKKEDISLGKNVIIEEDVKLIGLGNQKKKIEIGDNVYIGESVKIIGDQVTIRDYTKLHNHSFLYALKPMILGYNNWIGQNVILNSEETLILGNNVCIAAYSQVWTHMKYGDRLEGCRFLKYEKTVIEDDVWIGPKCIIAPINAKRKSMALAGSVIVDDMEENHVYAGVPAKDVTGKTGPQFCSRKTEDKIKEMNDHWKAFQNILKGKLKGKVVIVTKYPKKIEKGITYFNVIERTYTKWNTELEIRFMNYLLPEKGKFIPRGDK